MFFIETFNDLGYNGMRERKGKNLKDTEILDFFRVSSESLVALYISEWDTHNQDFELMEKYWLKIQESPVMCLQLLGKFGLIDIHSASCGVYIFLNLKCCY